MTIIKNDAFDEFFSSLSLIKPKDDEEFEKILIIPERRLSDNHGLHFSEPIYIWYRKSCRINHDSVLKKISEELKKSRHDEINVTPKIFLVLICLANQNNENYSKYIDSLIQKVESADTSLFLIFSFPAHPDFKSYKMNDFIVGKVDLNTIIYRCKKVKCDYFDKYPELKNKYKNRFSIQREFFAVKVLNWEKISKEIKGNYKLVISLYDYYFESTTQLLETRFYEDFNTYQEPLVSFGAAYISLSSETFGQSTFFAIYQNIGNSNTGYFCPFNKSLTVSFPDFGQSIPDAIEQLQKKYNFNIITDSEIHQTLKSYCKFITKAINHKINNRQDEAFLHYIIALDLLFGEKDSSNATISKRTAIVTYKILNCEFTEIVKRIKNLYDVRSNYVHSGKPIEEKDIEYVEPIIYQVLLCLLRIQANFSNHYSGFFQSWIKELDFFIAALKAGIEIDNHQLTNAGIDLVNQD